MTTAWGRQRLPFSQAILGRTTKFVLGLIILLTFSQAWVFPMLGDIGDPAASGLIRTLFFPAYGLGLVLLVASPGKAILAGLRQPFLILLMAVIGASILWSIAPDQTARRALAIYATTLCAIVLAADRTWTELVELFATSFAVLICLSYVFSLLVPAVGIMHDLFPGAWRGVWAEKNLLGGNMTLGVCVLLAAAVLSPTRRVVWSVLAGLAFLLILLSTSKTSLVAVLLGLGAFGFVLMLRRGPIVSIVMTWLAVVILGILAGLVLLAPDVFFDLLGKDATFTGRTKIWQAVWRQIEQRPWTGFGYGAVWSEEGHWGPLAWITKQAGFRGRHAHNAWLEQWLGLGFTGLVAFVLMQLQFLLGGINAAYRGIGGILALPFFICYTIICITESVAVIYNDFRWVFFTAIAVKLFWPDENTSEPRVLA